MAGCVRSTLPRLWLGLQPHSALANVPALASLLANAAESQIPIGIEIAAFDRTADLDIVVCQALKESAM
jgi:hypothetical protein